MRSLICAALLISSTAHAEDRAMVTNLGAAFGALGGVGMDADPTEGLFGPRISPA